MGNSGQQHTTARELGGTARRSLLAVSATGLLVLTACGGGEDPQSAPSGDGPVLVGAGPTIQTQAVADAWVLALEDGGIAAEVRQVEGGRAAYLKAVEDGTLDVYPDYTGDLYLELDAAASAEPTAAEPTATASEGSSVDTGGLIDSLTSLLGQDPANEGFTDADVESALEEQLPEGLTLLATGSADRTRAMAVTAATGAQLSGSTLDSLSGDCSKMTIGVPKEETEQPVTVPALEELYGCEPREVVGFDSPEETVEALLRNEVQAAVVVTTRPEIEDNALVVLDDDAGAMIPERVVPVADEQLPQNVRGVLDDVDDRLDAEAMTLLTRMTTAQDLYSPYEAADYWWGTQN